MPEIGETLREARMRARIDVSEIEAQTKIRAKYLRALENEEWDLLPGPTFVKSFLRTYATALGLDGKALVEEYRKSAEPPSEAIEPIGAAPRHARAPGGGPSRGYMVLVAIVLVMIVLLIVGLLSNGGKSSSNTTGTSAKTATGRGATGGPRHRAGTPTATPSGVVSLSLRAVGTVYVCLIGEGGRKLIAGKTLEAGARTATFTARRFELTLGNNAVTLVIDGAPRPVPASARAIGYVITKAGRRTLAPGHLPTCT
ncbi:MAG TPA: helix-turn-helix domain-containing protein [Solirubrobacteraceae bacterium]|nr:helix-turn-helix domain-containing protein [Solirubrobacteraceae bacterium]